jgi:dihydroflavonol-4-reductase
VPTTLVTGATGFVGSHVVRALLERGDDVRVTVRKTSTLDALEGLDVDRVTADVTDRRAMRRAVKGVRHVFHIAGSTSLRATEESLFKANVTGTRVVMEACLEEGVERVVHTSSVSALGPAPRGSTADETQVPHAADLAGVPYAAAKLAAEQEAMRAAAHGLPVVVVNPAHVLGAGDYLRSSTELVRRFLLRRIPAYVDGAINVVDVRDVAAGHLLADELGVPGERYILGNRNYTWERLFADIGRFSGVEPPALKLPVAVALALGEAAQRLPGHPPIMPSEVRAACLWWTYRSTKARRELGWTTRHHEDTVEATVAWWRERLGPERVGEHVRQPIQLRLVGAAVRRVADVGNRIAGD